VKRAGSIANRAANRAGDLVRRAGGLVSHGGVLAKRYRSMQQSRSMGLLGGTSMSDLMAVVLIAYVQCGLLVAWYLCDRRVALVRGELAAQQAAHQAALRDIEAQLAELQRQLRELYGRQPRALLPAGSHGFKQAKRRGALEMARRGMDAPHIAHVLNMRRAEVEMLVRLERLQRDTAAQAHNALGWLETAS
jgi:hypothetical protein